MGKNKPGVGEMSGNEESKTQPRKEIFASPEKKKENLTSPKTAGGRRKKPGLKLKFEEDSDEVIDEGFKIKKQEFEIHVQNFLKNVHDKEKDEGFQLGNEIPNFMPK